MKYRLALPGVTLLVAPAAAQIDYRRLDRGRPAGIEDAYPIERYAFEVAGGYRISRIGPGRAQQLFEPGLSFGAGAALELGVGGPIAITDRDGGRATGLAGLHLSAKATLTTERPWLPGLGLRFDGVLPVGSESGSGLGTFVSILATRSFGRNRLHVNAGASLGRPEILAGAEALPNWRSAWRLTTRCFEPARSWWGFVVERAWNEAEVSLSPGVGFRRQLTPTVVLDCGVGLERPSFTVGLSHAFGLAGLMPGARQ